VDILLEGGALIDVVTDVGGCTPLHEAARAGSIAGMRQLVREGADTKLNNTEGKLFMECIEQEHVRTETLRALEELFNDPEVEQRKQLRTKRPNSSLRKKNTSERQKMHDKKLAPTRGRVCGMATKLWAPPDFQALASSPKGGAAESQVYAPDVQPQGAAAEEEQESADLEEASDEATEQSRRDSLASLGEVSEDENQNLTSGDSLVPSESNPRAKSAGSSLPSCLGGGDKEQDPSEKLVKVTLEHGAMQVSRAYSKSSAKLGDLTGDCALIFGIDAKDIALLLKDGSVVSSSQQLRDELQSSSEITLRVMAVGNKGGSRLCGECR